MTIVSGVSLSHEVEQQPVIAQRAMPSELSMRIDALVAQQHQLIPMLVGQETELKRMERETPSSADRPSYQIRLDRQREGVATLRGELAETQAQLDLAQAQSREMRVGAQTTTAEPESRIFGLTIQEAKFAGSFILLLPLVIAIAIRIAKRGSKSASAPIAPDRFARLETAMESIAVEVERLGESQRFTSKLLNEAQPKQQPIAVKPNYDRLMRTPV